MKKITIIILSIMMVFAKVTFAGSGWQFGFMIPIGASLGFYNVSFAKNASEDYKNNYKRYSTTLGFDAGITFQAGYLVSDEDKGISLLFDLGYSHDSFGLTSSHLNDENNKVKEIEYYTFENLQIGILPKFHYKNFDKCSLILRGLSLSYPRSPLCKTTKALTYKYS